MKPNTSEPADVSKLDIDLSKIPPLLSVEGVGQYLAPLSRSLLYEAASRGEIQSASVGIGRGRRLFLTSSIAEWLQRRAAKTHRPNIAPRRRKSKSEGMK
jgi:hypothetical protein